MVGQGFAISALRAAAARRLRSETRLRAQCVASSFSTWKRNQKTLGGGRNRQKRLRRPCLHAARPPRTPITGDAYLSGIAIFPAHKI